MESRSCVLAGHVDPELGTRAFKFVHEGVLSSAEMEEGHYCPFFSLEIQAYVSLRAKRDT